LRRRRRRKLGAGPTPAEDAATEAALPADVEEDEGEEPDVLSSDDAVVEVEHEPTAEEEEDEEVDDLSNLDVPSWQEIVASLYRPER
jgi:hypothetical protein